MLNTNLPPAELLVELTKRHFETALLVGGAMTNAAFFAAGLVDELWVPMEPLIFGNGRSLVEATQPLNISLTLESTEQLNSQGTILLKYLVGKSK